MWLFSQRGFLSIVRHSIKPGVLVVRSRFPGHIQAVFPKAHVTECEGTDYRYRTELNPSEVSKVIAKMILKIDYDNFKGSLDADDERYFESCMDVYSAVLKHSGDWEFSHSDYFRGELNEG